MGFIRNLLAVIVLSAVSFGVAYACVEFAREVDENRDPPGATQR